MPSAAASSGVEGRISRARTRDVGARPRRSISRENVISRSARRWAGGSATKLPRPGMRTTRPSSARRCIALRAVIRLTPNSSHSAVSDGSGSPGASVVDPLAQRALDPAPSGDDGSAALTTTPPPTAAAARSAPWTAAPIAPAQTPSSAGTSSTASSDVVWTRAASSSRIGANRRSPAAATPPPMTTRSGEMHDDHVGDPDAQVAADQGQPLERPRIAGPGAGHRLLGGRRPARRGDPVGARERLEAAVVAAAARRPVRVDRLVAQLAGRPVVALVDPAVDRDHAADPGPEREADHRSTRRARRRAGAPPARTPARR